MKIKNAVKIIFEIIIIITLNSIKINNQKQSNEKLINYENKRIKINKIGLKNKSFNKRNSLNSGYNKMCIIKLKLINNLNIIISNINYIRSIIINWLIFIHYIFFNIYEFSRLIFIFISFEENTKFINEIVNNKINISLFRRNLKYIIIFIYIFIYCFFNDCYFIFIYLILRYITKISFHIKAFVNKTLFLQIITLIDNIIFILLICLIIIFAKNIFMKVKTIEVKRRYKDFSKNTL